MAKVPAEGPMALPTLMVMCVISIACGTMDDALQEARLSYNATCPEDCTCGLLRSTHLHHLLNTFHCSFANMKSFPPNIPLDIQALIINGNSIRSVPDPVSRLTELQELDLSGNSISSLGRGGMFQNMSRLEYLNMAKNAISTIFHDNLLGLKNLEQLVLFGNKLTYIEDKAFADQTHLLTLVLENNLLGSLYAEWFRGLDSLVELNLAYNRIHNIPASVFLHLHSLERLDLTGNRISTVNPGAFAGLTNLQHLVIKDNFLSKIPAAAFQSLLSLLTLNLDQNPLVKIKPMDFSNLSVTKISLCQMPKLEIIDSKGFYDLANITTIKVTHNSKLAYVDPFAFMNVETLKDLQLHNNNLRGIEKEIVDILPEGVQVSLYNNPLHCDCNGRWLRQLMDERDNVSVILVEPEHLTCSSPPPFAYKLLKHIFPTKLPKTCLPVVLNLTQTQSVVREVGEKQILECRALGSPRPQLRWILPDGSLVNSTLNEVRRRFFPPGTLVYYHLKPRDGGLYTCVAENSVGETRSSLTLNVTGIDIHLFPKHVSSTLVTLIWNGTECRAFPSYKIIFTRIDANGTDVGERRSRNASPTRKVFSITGLHPDSTYRFCIGYEDTNGYWLQISCCIASTDDLEYRKQGLSRISNVAVAAVVVLVLAATLLGHLVSLAVRKYRQRTYQATDKVGEDSSIPLDNLYRPLLMGSDDRKI
ncbi:leucine-rich repeat neuronal protein 1-like [Penaeus chinensis]|uniref:leucine-rich repeat neuronal protein 1-like n=1 Tax=Penaeus chinensis TaxID=139456 RepID=UPI001FB850EB|nr:leucine-rich repeat neuronal protein 1-like [Penaeus chinensis]